MAPGEQVCIRPLSSGKRFVFLLITRNLTSGCENTSQVSSRGPLGDARAWLQPPRSGFCPPSAPSALFFLLAQRERDHARCTLGLTARCC